jgi:hypothetical protein
VMVYGRGSWVRGQFGDSHEYGGGVKWHLLPTERLWINARGVPDPRARRTAAPLLRIPRA